MDFEVLNHVLKQKTGDNFEISRCVLAKFGCISFSSKRNLLHKSPHPLVEFENLDDNQIEDFDYQKDIIANLEKSPHIFELEVLNKHSSSFRIMPTGSLLSGDLFLMQLQIPKKSQKYLEYEDELSLPSKTIEGFSAICDGSLFCAFSSVKDIHLGCHFGHECREIIVKQLENGKLAVDVVGPSPFHSDFYFVFSKNHSGPTKIVESDDDIFIITQEKDVAPYEVATALFYEIRRTLESFYALKLWQIYTYFHSQEITSLFSELVLSYTQLTELKIYRPFEKSKISKRMRKGLLEIYKRIYQTEEVQLNFDSQYKRFRNEAENDRFLNKVLNYLELMCENDAPKIQNSLYAAIKHMEESVKSFEVIRASTIAALLVALVTSPIINIVMSYFFSIN